MRLVGTKPLSEATLEIVDSNLTNKLQRNLKRNSYIFIQGNAFQNVVYEMAAICLALNMLLSQPLLTISVRLLVSLPCSIVPTVGLWVVIHIDDVVGDYSFSSALAMEIVLSCT